jgi:hypothetical protein
LADPNNVEEWLNLVSRHEVTAKLTAKDKIAAASAHFHVGLAVEAALKAYIMKTERLNSWPSRETRPELYTHDLRNLVRFAKLNIRPQDKIAPAWALLKDWDRNQGYDPKPMPLKVAQGWVEAAFGQDGFVTWLRTHLT